MLSSAIFVFFDFAVLFLFLQYYAIQAIGWEENM